MGKQTWVPGWQSLYPRLLPRQVRESRTYRSGFSYGVCPRCRRSLDREYMPYCSNCGQKLDWSAYEDGEPASIF